MRRTGCAKVVRGGSVSSAQAGSSNDTMAMSCRDSQVGGPDRLERPYGHQVVGHQQSGSALVEKVLRPSPAPFDTEISPQQYAVSMVRSRHGLARSPRDALPRSGHRSDHAEKADPRVASREEVLRTQAGAGDVRRQHGIGALVVNRTVEGNDRSAAVDQLADLGCPSFGWGDDRSRHSLGDKDAQVLPLLDGIVVGVAQQDPVALHVGTVLDGPHHLGKVRVLYVGDHHADHLHLLAAQVACHPAGSIAELVDGREDLRALGLPHRDGAVEDSRHRGRGHSCPVGDLFYG
jgi:hypothetical protein